MTARVTGAPCTPATRSASSAAAVSFESGWPPTAQEKPPLFAWCASSQRVVCFDDRPSASTAQQVELTVVPMRPFGDSARCRRSRSAAGCAPSASSASATSATSVGVASVGLLRLQVRERAGRLLARRREAEHRPGRQRSIRGPIRLRERAAVRVRLHELHRRDRQHERSEERRYAHTTTVRRRPR